MTSELGGPYLAIAVLCEKVLEDKDGVLSAIRVVDRIIQTVSGQDPPEKMPPVTVRLTALLSFKSGFARGPFTVKIKPQTPSGLGLPEVQMPILLEGEDRGANLILNLEFQADQEGLYWFDVTLGEQLLTRMPLRLVYQRLSLGRSPET